MCLYLTHIKTINITKKPFVLQNNNIYIKSTPLEITIQAGEFEVFKSICQTSIPYLLGWNTCMDIASAAAISKGLSGGGGMY